MKKKVIDREIFSFVGAGREPLGGIFFFSQNRGVRDKRSDREYYHDLYQ